MISVQYIYTTEDRVELLENRLREEKTKHEVNTTKYLFNEQPSIKAVRKPTKPTSELDWKKAKDFYSELYSPTAEQ